MSMALVFVLLSLAAWMPNEASAQQIAYRLAGAPIGRSNEGRLEVCYSGSWGTVCDNYFNNVAARVACRSLGYLGGGIFINNRWGPGSGPIWLDTVYCNGSEQNIDDCYHRPVGEHNCGHHEDVSISCYNYTSTTAQSPATTPPGASSQDGNNYLRLAGSSNPGEGRLEVYHNGFWGTICDDLFDNTAAAIACRNLGYGNGGVFVNNRFGPGVGTIWLDDVRCNGQETSFFACSHNPWESHNCAHSEDVSIICSNASTTSPINANTQGYNFQGVRLVNNNSSSSNPTAGRLEVYYNGTWGTICDDGFTNFSAQVACFSLGFGRIGYFAHNTYGFGSESVPIWLNQVSCIGNESNIVSCRHLPWGIRDCGHYEDVSINCNATGNQAGGYNYQGVRLVNANSSSSNPTAGRLEVYYNGTWGTVCDDGFNDACARVACFSLGFGYIGSFFYNTYGAGSGPIFLDQVSCIGNELNIAGCSHNPVGVHDCSHSEDVSITCINAPTTSPINNSTQGRVRAEGWRLVDNNSSSSNPIAGRLEVRINGTWGTVCDDDFSDIDAHVACFSLGFGYTGSFFYNVYGPGTGPIWLDQVSCIGYESDIGACSHNPVGVHDCLHSEDVSISCAAPGGQAGGNTTVSPPPLNATAYASTTTSRINFSTSHGFNASTTSPINNSSQGLVRAEGWRLVDNNSPSSNPIAGRLEVLINGTWGTVCDDGFNDACAQVACFSLGFGRIGYFNQNNYGPGTGSIYLDQVSCIGYESDIGVCSHNPVGVHDCVHSEDVSISCTTAGIQVGANSSTTTRSNLSTSQGTFAPANAMSNANSTTVRINGASSTTRSNITSARVNALYNATTSRANATTRLTTRINPLAQTTRTNATTTRPSTISPAGK